MRVERLQRDAELLHELRIERIHLLRPVQRNDADAAFVFDLDEVIAHG